VRVREKLEEIIYVYSDWENGLRWDERNGGGR